LPITATNSIELALEHTKRQLFRPFQIGQWTKLAFVGMLAGELGSKGCNRSNFQIPGHPGLPSEIPHDGLPGALGIDPALLAALSALLGAFIVIGFAIGLILMYVGSVMRFVLFDSILTRECHIRKSWSHRLDAGWRYFVWKFLYFLLAAAGIAVLAGVPLAIAFAKGWLREPREHLPPLILGGVFLFLAAVVFAIITAVILVLTKDFVVPQMALENISAMEGWRRLWIMMQAEKGAYAGYIGLKILLAIVAGIIIGIATVILGVIFVVPTVGLSLLAVLTGQSAGWTWNAHTIFLAVAVGTILLAAFLYLVSLISVPAIVFFPAYSMYFFAGRYPRLAAALYPPPPAVGGPAVPSP
jgi:hypothetical protein